MASSYVFNVLLAATKVVVWFCIIFILLPRQIFPAPRQGESRVWADVVRMGFYTTLIVHVLVLIGIYDLFSLMTGYVLLYLLLLFLRPKGPVLSEAEGLPLTDAKSLFTRLMVFVMNALEGRVSCGEWVRRRRDDFKNWVRRQVPGSDQIMWGLALLWVLLVSVYLRLYETLNHAALTPTFYSHLKWLKGLTRKQLYVDGIYPYGAFTILSGLQQFTFLDEAVLLRVAQGLAGGLTVAALYFCFSGRRDAALLGSALYGIFTFAYPLPGLPLYPDEALPLEMALAFLLPTWVFLARYLTERKSTWLTLAFQGTVTVFLIHPLIGAVTLAGWVLALPAGLIYGRWRGQDTLLMALAAAGTVILGNIFYLVGWLGGKVWGEGPLVAAISLGASRPMAALTSMLACAVLGVVYGIVVSWLGETRFFPKNLVSLGATVVILATLLATSPPLVIKGASKAEYDAVALKIYDIKEERLAYTWTIIGAGEVLPHILGRGWYLNGDYFLQHYSPETYHYDPKQPELYVPTEHVYIVVEKNVYAAPFTATGLRERAAMEQALWDWCRTFEQLRDNMTVYYQDNDIVIYHIHHPLLPADNEE